jgi:flagellar protein FliJ
LSPESLATLLQLATRSRDDAAMRRGALLRDVNSARKQLEMLTGYTHDYGQRARTQQARGIDGAAQINARAFSGKLDAAVAAAQAEVTRREQLLARAEQELVELQKRVYSLQTLGTRQVARERHVQGQREQRQSDELAGRSVRQLSPADAALPHQD